MRKKNFTMIPNLILGESQLSIQARYLLCVLLRYCMAKTICWPSQKTLAKDLGCSERYVRNLLKELAEQELIDKDRIGWNRSNTYIVEKNLISIIDSSSNAQKIVASRNCIADQTGTQDPVYKGNTVPANNINVIRKEKNKSKGK